MQKYENVSFGEEKKNNFTKVCGRFWANHTNFSITNIYSVTIMVPETDQTKVIVGNIKMVQNECARWVQENIPWYIRGEMYSDHNGADCNIRFL